MINPFEILEIAPTLLPEKEEVDAQYRKLIKLYHPDKFSFDSDEYNDALEHTSHINQAYKLLGDRIQIAAFFLKEDGFVEGQEKMPADFLMEMMDINESIAEAEIEGDEARFKAILTEVEQINAQNDKDYVLASEALKAENTGLAMQLLKKSYLKMKYILRLKERLINFAAR